MAKVDEKKLAAAIEFFVRPTRCSGDVNSIRCSLAAAGHTDTEAAECLEAMVNAGLLEQCGRSGRLTFYRLTDEGNAMAMREACLALARRAVAPKVGLA
jgi:hypothetical protein